MDEKRIRGRGGSGIRRDGRGIRGNFLGSLPSDILMLPWVSGLDQATKTKDTLLALNLVCSALEIAPPAGDSHAHFSDFYTKMVPVPDVAELRANELPATGLGRCKSGVEFVLVPSG